jgi:hypothetical protein
MMTGSNKSFPDLEGGGDPQEGFVVVDMEILFTEMANVLSTHNTRDPLNFRSPPEWRCFNSNFVNAAPFPLFVLQRFPPRKIINKFQTTIPKKNSTTLPTPIRGGSNTG